MAEKLDKIWTFVAKVLGFVVVGLVAGYSWITKQVVVMPREWIALTMAILVAVGIGSYGLAYVRRSQLGRLGSIGMAAVGTFCSWARSNSLATAAAKTSMAADRRPAVAAAADASGSCACTDA
jgi:hypothetical protein